MDRVFTGAFDATIDSMGTRRDWEEGAKNRLNRLGLRSATLENAVTGKKVPSTAIGLPHMLYNKDRAIGESQHWKQEAEEASAREIGPVGLLNVLLNVLNTQEQLFNNMKKNIKHLFVFLIIINLSFSFIFVLACKIRQ